MVMKDTYGFSSKAKAREKSKEFIGDHYSASDLKNMNILTLLGHEPYELEQIWDPLGVPRSNITVVENLPKSYKILKNANYGVNLQPRQEISDFLAETDNAFDVINLDYQGYMNLKRLRNIEDISYRNLLEDRGTLLHWVSGKRERKETQEMQSLAASSFLGYFKNILNTPWSQANPEKAVEVGKTIDKIEELFESDVRENIPELLVESMAKGVLYEETHPLISSLSSEEKYHDFLKKNPYFQDIGKGLMEVIQHPRNMRNPFNDSVFDRVLGSFETLRKRQLKMEKPILEEFREYANLVGGGFQEKYVTNILNWKLQSALKNISPTLHEDDKFLETLTQMIYRSHVKGYSFNDGGKFKYISDKGTPMFLDMIQFKKDVKSPINYKIKDKKLLLKKGEFYSNNLFKKLKEFTEWEKGTLLDHFAEPRILLTGDSNEVQETKELSKNEIYGLLKEGKTKEEILEINPSLNPRTISAYQAHVTMDEQGIKKGRPRKQKTSKLEEKSLTPEITKTPIEIPVENDSEKEELSKEDAIWLLKQGFDTKEILENYPGVFTDYQLRGYKAHVTRGTL